MMNSELNMEVRMALVEREVDAMSKMIMEIRKEIKRTNQILIGLLVSMVSGTGLFSLNILGVISG